MNFETWYLYAIFVAAIVITPGPSTLLAASRSLERGFRESFATIAGDLTANMVQMGIAASGLCVIFATSPSFTSAIKWFGVAYLVTMGIRMGRCRQGGPDRTRMPDATLPVRLFLEGFLVSAANPKALLFFFCLFPPFIDASLPVATQIVTLGLTFVGLDGMSLIGYAAAARFIGVVSGPANPRRAGRLTGATMMILAGLILAMKSIR